MTHPVYSSKQWRDLRLVILERDGNRCRVCGAPATLVDHVLPVCEAPMLAFDPDNLRAACRCCNALRARPVPPDMGSRNPSREW